MWRREGRECVCTVVCVGGGGCEVNGRVWDNEDS